MIIQSKAEYFDELSTYILEPIYLTDKTDELNKEIEHNMWVLTCPYNIIAETTTDDILEFIKKVKTNYINQLGKSSFSIDLIFYLWLDPLAQQLRFNFINSNHNKLPFRCKVQYTDKPEDIIREYLHSKYHEVNIPWKELQIIETSEEIDEATMREKELQENYVLTVYQERISKQAQTLC